MAAAAILCQPVEADATLIVAGSAWAAAAAIAAAAAGPRIAVGCCRRSFRRCVILNMVVLGRGRRHPPQISTLLCHTSPEPLAAQQVVRGRTQQARYCAVLHSTA